MEAQKFDKHADAKAMQEQCARLGPAIIKLSAVGLAGSPFLVPLVMKVEMGHRCQDDFAVMVLHVAERNHVDQFKERIAVYADALDEVAPWFEDGLLARESVKAINTGKVLYRINSALKV